MKINIKLFLLFISIILISSCSDYRKILKTPGFEKKLELNGIGYKVQKKGNDLHLFLGYSHPITFKATEGIDLDIEGQTIIFVRGIDNQKVGEAASNIIKLRDARKDPYKGKGVKLSTTILRKKAGKKVADILDAQDETVETLNKFYKKFPEELLNNTKLRNLLDLTLKDGEIVKKNKYVSDDDFLKLIKERPLFTKDHVDEVQFEKLSTEFPVFRQLATYNTNSGLIRSIKSYVAKNQNSKDPVVQNKIKKQIAFLDTIYESQDDWITGSDISEINNNLKKIVKILGINSTQFDKCVNNEVIGDKILNGRIDGHKKYSINSTPTIIINEKKLNDSASFKNIKKKIEKLI